MSARLWSELAVPRAGSLAVLAPHPDDFDAIAVTLRRFRDLGWTLQLAVLSGGASGVQEGYGGARDDAARCALREAEQRASCAAFGLPEQCLHFLRLAEDERGHPHDDEANRACLRRFLALAQPSRVFMPHGNDSNVAHRRSWEMFRRIAQEDGLQLEAWLNRDAKTLGMREDVIVPFGAEEADWKAGLLRLHASQQARNLATRGHGFDERVLAVNAAAAQDCGRSEGWAEVFELQHLG